MHSFISRSNIIKIPLSFERYIKFYYDNKVEDFYKNKIVHIKEFTILKEFLKNFKEF